MIIDAEGTIGQVLKAVLSQAGHVVATTADGLAGVEAYKIAHNLYESADRGIEHGE